MLACCLPVDGLLTGCSLAWIVLAESPVAGHVLAQTLLGVYVGVRGLLRGQSFQDVLLGGLVIGLGISLKLIDHGLNHVLGLIRHGVAHGLDPLRCLLQTTILLLAL